MVLYLVVSNTTYVYAEAATIAITGGSVAAGGLTGAVGGAALAPYAVPIIFGALLGYGINVELTKESQAAGLTKTQFIQNKVQQYGNEIGTGVDAIYQNILENASVAKNGAIYLGSKAKEQIWQFGNYLFKNDMVLDSTQSGDSSQIKLGDYNVNYLSTVTGTTGGNYSYLKTFNLSEPVACFFLQSDDAANTINLYFVTKNKGVYYTEGTSTGQLNTIINGYYFASKWLYRDQINTFNPSLTIVTSPDIRTFLNSLDGTFNPGMDTPNTDSFVGTADPWSSGQNVLNPSNDYPAVLNPGLTGSLDLPQTGAYDIPVDSYIGALGDVLNGVQDVDLPAIDTRTGEKENIRVNDDTLDPAIDTPDDPDVPSDNTPIINPDQPADPALTSSEMNVQFKGVFPFCIPFDVKDMIGLLNAEPEAPSYHVRWYIPFADTYLDFNVDLSGWDSTAAICRQMELLLFCLGLAFVTRSMFIRG